MGTERKFIGCFLGLALGDAMGAPFEGGFLERFLWKLIGKTRNGKLRWTDDTQMSIDLANSLILNKGLNSNHLSEQFASSYNWSRGYGPAAARLLKKIKNGKNWKEVNRSIYPQGSFGNGGAMRVPVLGLFYNQDPLKLLEETKNSVIITHAHPAAIEGAVLIAISTSMTLNSIPPLEIITKSKSYCKLDSYLSRLLIAEKWLTDKKNISPDDVSKSLGNSITAEGSCVTALYISLRFINDKFKNMIKFVINCGGDVDTIGAMAGAIWGAARGVENLPDEYLGKLEKRDLIQSIAVSLFKTSQKTLASSSGIFC